MNALTRMATVAGTTAALFATIAASEPASAVDPHAMTDSACVVNAHIQSVAMFPTGPAEWRLERPSDGREWAGQYDPATGVASVNPDMPCGIIPSVVAHEWAHAQQHHAYNGDWPAALAAYQTLDNMELLADCAALYVGATYTPYADEAGGCTPEQMQYADYLINFESE